MISQFFIFLLCLYGLTRYSTEAKIQEEWVNSLIKNLIPGHNEKINYNFAKLVRSHSSRSKRETRPVEFYSNGEVIKLHLTPVEDNVWTRDLPVWTVRRDPRAEFGHIYEKVDHEYTKLDGVFYEDVQNQALLYAYYRDGLIYYDGVIGEGKKIIVIRSIIERWHEDDSGSHDHVIFQVESKNETVSEELGDVRYYGNTEKSAKPLDVLYPKLLLVVEYNNFKIQQENIAETLKYLTIMWNQVGMKYREIPSPQVKIKITGVIIEKEEGALDFIKSARNATDKERVNSNAILNGGTEYFQKNFSKILDFNNFDSAVVLTSLHAGRIAGSAYVARICQKNVIYVNDDCDFTNLQTATHELGHSIGLLHDNEDRNSYPKESYVMLHYVSQPYRYVWSEKSIKQLHTFASVTASSCLEKDYRM